jgi:hypothetical protein
MEITVGTMDMKTLKLIRLSIKIEIRDVTNTLLITNKDITQAV